MLRCHWLKGTILVIAGLLAGACGPVSARKPAEPVHNPALSGTSTNGLDAAAAKAARAHAHYASGFIHEMNDEADAALDDYSQAVLDDPENEKLALDLSRRFLQRKQPEKALEVLTRSAARPDASGALYARLAVVYSELAKTDLAVDAGRTAIKRSPKSLAGYQTLFLIYLQNKREQDALKVLDEAGRQSGTDPDFLIGLAELYLNYLVQAPTQKAKLTPTVLALLNRAQARSPATAQLRLRLADGFIAAGDTEKGAQLYLDLLKTLPDVPFIRQRVHAKLASIYLRGSDSKRAMEQLQAVLRDDPTNPQAHYYLGRLCYEQKDPAAAAEHLGKTILLNPGMEEAYLYLALSQISLNQPGEALATLEKARTRFQQDFDLELISALAYGRQKDYAEAVRHYTAAEVIAKATDPARLTKDFYFEVGAACERSGDLAQAEQYFNKCLQLAPDFPEALNYLGYMWVEHNMKLDQARELIEKAVKAEPENAAYLDSLAWVLFKQNHPQDALNHLLKAVGLMEASKAPDATVYDHLGDIYTSLNQPDKARAAWLRALALEPTQEVRKKLGPAAPSVTPAPADSASQRKTE